MLARRAHGSRIQSLVALMLVSAAAFSQQADFPRKTGVQDPAIRHSMEDLARSATIVVKGDPDWLALTADWIWVTSEDLNHVSQIDPKTNRVTATIRVRK